MSTVFLSMLHASIYGSIVILAVLLLRTVLRNAPKRYICLLWLLAALRLLIPFGIESKFSLQPTLPAHDSIQSGSVDITTSDLNFSGIPGNSSGITDDTVINAGNELIPNVNISNFVSLFSYRIANYSSIAAVIWLIGITVMLLFNLISYLRLRNRIKNSVIFSDGVWICPELNTSFVLGFLHPRIYLNSGLTDEQRSFVLQHERCHIRRGDHLWKLFGFAILSLHWFNPLVWLAYTFMCRDLEMACDETVVKNMSTVQRKAYSTALLACSVNQQARNIYPIAFSEVSVKERIKNVLNYKKPKFWFTVLLAAAILAVCISLLTDPAGMTDDEILETLYSELAALQNQESIHLKLTIESDSELGGLGSQDQEFWMKGGDWYRSFHYTTNDGSYTTTYLQKDGVQYASEYSLDIPGFNNRSWAQIPQSSYAELPAILTKDYEQLEVLDIRRIIDGRYTVTIRYDYSGGIHDTVHAYYQTFTLDQDGKLLGATTYSDIEMYISSSGREGICETKTNASIYILEPDDAMLEQLIADALGQ